MATTTGTSILKTDLDALLTTLNQARSKWGLSNTTLSNYAVGDKATSAHMTTIVNGLNSAINTSGASISITDLPSYSVGSSIKPTLFTLITSKATDVYNYCSCDCNYCSCDCNYCSCDCDNCYCDCDNCCDYCTVSNDDGLF